MQKKKKLCIYILKKKEDTRFIQATGKINERMVRHTVCVYAYT